MELIVIIETYSLYSAAKYKSLMYFRLFFFYIKDHYNRVRTIHNWNIKFK